MRDGSVTRFPDGRTTRDAARVAVDNALLADAAGAIAETLRGLPTYRSKQEFVASVVAVAIHYRQVTA